MKLLVIDKHDKYEGMDFPTFKEGTTVSELRNGSDDEYPHWFPCVIDGHDTFVPDVFVKEGKLTRDYNPTEMEAEKDQMLTLVEVVFGWLHVKNKQGKFGWIPADNIVSVP